MVLDEELRPLHELTVEGIDEYHRILEREADEILFKHEHPFRWLAQKIKDMFSKE